MANQVMARPQPANCHRRRGIGEVAGGATADCAAVCCCCPLAVVNLVVLAIYKLPRVLAKKAARRRRRRLLQNSGTKSDVGLLQPQRSSSMALDAFDITMGPTRFDEFLKSENENKNDSENKKCEEEEGLEKEMWARFAGTGFWRSDSQRQP